MSELSTRHVGLLVLVAAVLLFLAVSRLSPLVTADAADRYRTSARQGYDGGQSVGEVLVDGSVVLRIRAGAGGLSPYDRAEAVSQRLGAALDAGCRPEDIHTAQWGSEAVLLCGNVLLITVDSEHARRNHTTPLSLADTWATSLAGVLGGHHGGRVEYDPHSNGHDYHGGGNGNHGGGGGGNGNQRSPSHH